MRNVHSSLFMTDYSFVVNCEEAKNPFYFHFIHFIWSADIHSTEHTDDSVQYSWFILSLQCFGPVPLRLGSCFFFYMFMIHANESHSSEIT